MYRWLLHITSAKQPVKRLINETGQAREIIPCLFILHRLKFAQGKHY